MSEQLLKVNHLKKYFVAARNAWGQPTAMLKAVDDVSFAIHRGETLGLVGESGCGKSTLGRSIIGLYTPTAGEILFDGQKLAASGREQKIQMIFQDPYACLDPRMTVNDIIGEPLDIHRICRTKAERWKKICDLLALVGMSSEQAHRFPHEFSGGQRQRIGIARALAIQPQLLICDEPISALDVSIQAQVVNLLRRLQQELGLTYLFIAHDLAMVRYISQRVAVMYLGKIVEIAPTDELYARPLHPYTKALLSSVPLPDPDARQERLHLDGELPSPLQLPQGCRFSSRCPYAEDICRQQEPELKTFGSRQTACFFADAQGIGKNREERDAHAAD